MTKEEMKYKIEELQQRVEELENDVDYWQKEYADMEEIKDDLDYKLADMEISNGIKNINNFIFRLKIDDMYSEKLKDYIEQYLKFYNY